METVTKCTKIKDWNGKPIFQIEMSNGAIGESFNQEISKWKVGKVNTMVSMFSGAKSFNKDIKFISFKYY